MRETKAEIRSDGLHISGYVNVPGRPSRPVMTPRGKVIEVIEQRAFQRAIDKAGKIDLKVDHERTIASTAEKTLTAYEDAVGLRAEAIVTDEATIKAAREKRLRGWSFDMTNVVDEMEERAEGLPIRKVKNLDMSEVSLIIDKIPFYSSTSIEVRADEEIAVETRAEEIEIVVQDLTKKPVDYTEFETRINSLKVGK